MDQAKPGCADQNFFLDWQISQELKIAFRTNRPRVLHGLGREVFVGRGALWIDIKPHRLIMVSADHNRSMMPDPLNRLMRSWAVIDEIAQTPEVIKALLERLRGQRDCREYLK
jgi:hypothetical protein